ncbi:MAG TPA: plastocyanin/azurin family copper-binding protein [Gemmatimonadales bacterium]|nr:plastocyanin/azurin family copper-binding protein [Gemmatimonadales bacterium]
MKLLGLVPVLAVACGGNNGGTGPCSPGPATQLSKNGGDPTWYVNNPLPSPLGVTVKDANNCAVPGVVVNWSITTGGGGLSGTQSTTNASGIATISDSLGGASTQVVSATSAGLPMQAFNVMGLTPPTSGAVSLHNIAFDPSSVVVQTGGTVTWTWNDNPTPHNVTFTSGPTPPGGNPGTQMTGTYAPTFTTVGTYGYHCTIHAGMSGTVTVVH